MSLEKNSALEEELDGTREELNKYKAGLISKNDNKDNGLSEHSDDGTKPINGTLDPEVIELRRQIEKQATDLGSSHRTLSDLRSKNANFEERIMQINKELHGAQEWAKSLENELKENVAQKEDQEERIGKGPYISHGYRVYNPLPPPFVDNLTT